MAGFEDLLALAQAQGGQGGQPLPPTPGGGSPDLLGQLQALLAQGGGGGGMPPAGGSGGNPMLAAMAQLKPSYAPATPYQPNGKPAWQRGDENRQWSGKPGNPSDADLGFMGRNPTDGVLSDFENRNGIRATAEPVGAYDRGADGQLLNANVSKRNANKSGIPNQAMLDSDVMSGDAYVPDGSERKGNAMDKMFAQDKKRTTEQELEDVSNKMGSGDPSDDGNFPTNAEIRSMLNGQMTTKEFDMKWGKGAAAEILGAQEDADFDEGQPEQGKAGRRFSPNKDKDPTTRKIPNIDDDGDHEYR